MLGARDVDKINMFLAFGLRVPRRQPKISSYIQCSMSSVNDRRINAKGALYKAKISWKK